LGKRYRPTLSSEFSACSASIAHLRLFWNFTLNMRIAPSMMQMAGSLCRQIIRENWRMLWTL